MHALLELRQVLDGLDRRVHLLLREGGGDLEPAAVDDLVLDAVALEFFARLIEQIAVGAGELVVGLCGPDLGHLSAGGLILGDVAEFGHVPQHILEAVLVLAGVLSRVRQTRTLDHRSQQCAFGHVEFAGRLVEVVLRSDLDAVRLAAEVDGVEVVGEDLVLRQLLVDLERDEHLLDLAVEGALIGEVEVLDVLLGDRRTAAGVIVSGHTDDRTRQALDGDAAVLVEAVVLSGDGRLLHRCRDLVDRDVLAVLGLEGPEHGLAVVVVDRRGLSGGFLVRFGDVGDGITDAEEADDDDAGGEDADADEPRRGQPASPAGHALARIVEQAFVHVPARASARLRCGFGHRSPKSECAVCRFSQTFKDWKSMKIT